MSFLDLICYYYNNRPIGISYYLDPLAIRFLILLGLQLDDNTLELRRHFPQCRLAVI